MLLLTTTTDTLRITTGAAVPLDVHASYMDLSGATTTPGRQNTAITTATTTVVVGAPGAATVRNVKMLSVRNKGVVTVDVTVTYDQNGTAFELCKTALSAGATLWLSDGGTVSAHHTTHEAGGTDAVALDASQIVSGSLGAARVGAHASTHNDGGSDELALDASQVISGALARARLPSSIAYEDESNTFAARQNFAETGALGTRLGFLDPTSPIDARKWLLFAYNQFLQISALNDAESAVTAGMTFYRNGDAKIGNIIFEAGRAYGVGYWQAGTLSSYITGGSGAYAWALVGKTMSLCFHGTVALAGAVANLTLNFPAGLTALYTHVIPFMTNVTGWECGFAVVNASNLSLFRAAGVAYPSGTATISGSLVIGIA